MIITCEKCDTSFELDDGLIQESGSEVKCSECEHVFTVQKPVAVEESEIGLEEEPMDLLDTEEEAAEEFDIEALGLEEAPDVEGPALEAEKAAAEEPPEAPEEAAEEKPAEEELDLETLSGAVEEAAEQKPMEEELDLEAISRAVEEAAEGPELVSEEITEEILDFDLLDAEEKPVKKEEVEFEEIGVEEERAAEEAARVEAETLAAEEPSPVMERVEVEEEPEEEMPPPVSEKRPMPPPAAMKAPAAGRRLRTPVIILLVLVLVAGGAYGGYVYLKSTGTTIPFLESLTGAPETATVDSGNLQIAVLEQEIGTGFVENTAAGRLLVIRGKVRNDYPHARNFIMVKGILYSKDGKAVQQKNIYCGNVFPDSDLQAVDKATMETKLRNRFGDKRSNFQVAPGKVLPFMVLFSDLPEDFGEFSIEVVSSAPAQ